MNVAGQKISDLMYDQKKSQNYITKETANKIASFSNNYEIYQIQLKRSLSEHLIMVRSGNQSIRQLGDALKPAYKHELSPQNVDFEQFLYIGTEFLECRI